MDEDTSTTRVVYNSCFGGFGLHNDVIRWVRANRDDLESQYGEDAVEELVNKTLPGGETDYEGRVNGDHASLQVAEVPEGVTWTIDRYDGKERVEEKSKTFS